MTTTDLMAELETIRCRLFDLANSQAGNDKGNAACFLHAASSEVSRAQECLKRGNPAGEPIPPHIMIQTLPVHVLAPSLWLSKAHKHT